MLQKIAGGSLYWGDCLEIMPTLAAGSVDMILCDMPYGTTQNKWDSVLPLPELWAEYRRICRGAIVLTAAQPFTSWLVSSNYKDFRYEWIWEKEPTGHLNAKKRPMQSHESILVFGAPAYSPQGTVSTLRKRGPKDNTRSENYGKTGVKGAYEQTRTGYPTSILSFAKDRNKLHPTQKPVALFEYLIKTYSNEGDLILDNTAGSGTTAIAAENTGRHWICIESNPDIFMGAMDRIMNHVA